jgi:hypothetical protein
MAPDADWTGARAAARVPVRRDLAAAAELELAVPDDAHGRGTVWPWALGAIRWSPTRTWQVGLGVEASASPEFQHRIDAMARVTRMWAP